MFQVLTDGNVSQWLLFEYYVYCMAMISDLILSQNKKHDTTAQIHL